MKKIGILFGQERSFPMAFIERVNSKGIEGIVAEPVLIDKVVQGEPSGYAVIIDRISQDVPFYRTYLKNAALMGTAVINNPFWWSADDKFFNNCLMTRVGVPVPKTVILPSYEMPTDTKAESFANLAYPLNWEEIFNYVGFPAYMKPYAGGGWKNVYKLHDINEFYEKHAETNQLVMNTIVVTALVASMYALCRMNHATHIICAIRPNLVRHRNAPNRWRILFFGLMNI
jgi:glutathione synthase/RimK-type ligase-like ATP-grasp enzyme